MYSKRTSAKNMRTFFLSLSSLEEGGPFFFLWHSSKGAGADSIPCLQRPAKRFLYSSKIRVHRLPKVSVLREDQSLVIFSSFSVHIGSELSHFLRSFLYAPGLEFHQDSPPPPPYPHPSRKQFQVR